MSLWQLIGYALCAMGLALFAGALFMRGSHYDPAEWF
jgi:hypothetical protein